MGKIIGIYKITSPINKIYIGQSVDINRRFIKYKNLNCKDQILLHRSLSKYGVKNHSFEIICQCGKEELNDLEIYYISLFNCFNNKYGLNLQSGGRYGVVVSDETRKKISNAGIGNKRSLGKTHSLETRMKMSVSQKGRKHSDETKLKISVSKKGNINSFGFRHTMETKAKILNSRKWYKHTEETKRKISESNKGKHNHSKETIDKIHKNHNRHLLG